MKFNFFLKKGIDDDWNKLDSFLKLGGFVNCNRDFIDQPKIINAASDLLFKIFGDNGKHSRIAISAGSLPLNATIEIDMIVEFSH